MPPTTAEIAADLDQIRDAIGGPDGINVRLARVEDAIKSHREQSTAAHAAAAAQLAKLGEDVAAVRASGWRISVDPSSAKAIAAILIALATAFASGGGVRGALDGLVEPAQGQQSASQP
jgi:hypothetical protein